MTGHADERNQLEHLLGAVRDGIITPAEMEQLDFLLRTSARARAYHLEYANLYAILRADHLAIGGSVDREPMVAIQTAPVGGRPTRFARFTRPIVAATAAVLVVGICAWLGGRPGAFTNEGSRGSSAAILVRSIDATWDSTAVPVASAMPQGRVGLKSGVVQVEFAGGAVVVLEGPADFEVRGPDRGYCRSGRLRVRLTPGVHPFTMETPVCEVIDQGTEFGLLVDASGRTEVHVFEGKVQVRSRVEPPSVELAAGNAIAVSPDGRKRETGLRESEFLSTADLDRWPMSDLAHARPGWAARSAKLRTDPRAVIYYPLDDKPPSAHIVRNRAPGERRDLDGLVAGCGWAAGRWPGKNAVEFRAAGGRVRVNTTERLKSTTLAAWVWIDSLGRAYNALFMTDDWSPGCLHWQMDSRGRLILGARGLFDSVSPVAARPEQFGQWLHLAATCDLTTGVVAHYVNGLPISTSVRVADGTMVVGPASLGNWDSPLRNNPDPVRTFSGRIDEFVMFREALTEDDVRLLYQAGRVEP